MIKCVFLGDWVMGQSVGLQRYTLQILKELDRKIAAGTLQADIRFLIPGNAEWESPFKKIRVVKAASITNKITKHLWPQLVFPAYVRLNRAVGIDLTNAGPLWGCDICSLPDCIPEEFPQFFRDSWFMKFQRMKNRSMMRRKGTQVVTLTNASRAQIEKFYGNPDDRISIVSCGWEHMDEICADPSIFDTLPSLEENRYFFSLGSKYRHKNFAWIFRAAKRNPQYQFVITGTDLFSREDGTEKMENPGNILFTGYISDGQVKALMQRCRALIQPSFCEGFGIPPLEVLSIGKPIIVSDTSSLPEIYGNSAYYIDPYGEACDLDALLNRSVGSAQPVLEQYTWKHAADQLLSVIEKVK